MTKRVPDIVGLSPSALVALSNKSNTWLPRNTPKITKIGSNIKLHKPLNAFVKIGPFAFFAPSVVYSTLIIWKIVVIISHHFAHSRGLLS